MAQVRREQCGGKASFTEKDTDFTCEKFVSLASNAMSQNAPFWPKLLPCESLLHAGYSSFTRGSAALSSITSTCLR